MANHQDRVITYVPREESGDGKEMGSLRRGVSFYTNQLGMNFTLVLCVSLFFQVFVAVFICLNGIRTLSVINHLSSSTLVINGLSLLLGLITQGLIIAEMAQVVWLRRPDKLKVRLMSDSFWWWVMLLALIISTGIDFFLLFLSVTGTSDLVAAWEVACKNQMAFATNLLFTILNLLTLLRCASVMRTSTSEEIRQEVEERLKAIAEEILIDAGDSARQKATKVWSQLSVDPQRFIPLHDSVFELISKQHPELVPSQLGGEGWAYDFSGNTFAALPPDVYRALLRAKQSTKERRKVSTFDDSGSHLWQAGPDDLAGLVGFNLETFGKPGFVDMTDPEQPRFVTRPMNMGAVGNLPAPAPSATMVIPNPNQTMAGASASRLQFNEAGQITRLSAGEYSRFVTYLSWIFKQKEKVMFQPTPDVPNIVEAFERYELEYHYGEFIKGGYSQPR